MLVLDWFWQGWGGNCLSSGWGLEARDAASKFFVDSCLIGIHTTNLSINKQINNKQQHLSCHGSSKDYVTHTSNSSVHKFVDSPRDLDASVNAESFGQPDFSPSTCGCFTRCLGHSFKMEYTWTMKRQQGSIYCNSKNSLDGAANSHAHSSFESTQNSSDTHEVSALNSPSAWSVQACALLGTSAPLDRSTVDPHYGHDDEHQTPEIGITTINSIT